MQSMGHVFEVLQAVIKEMKIWVLLVRSQRISESDNQMKVLLDKMEALLNIPELSGVMETVMQRLEEFLSIYRKKNYVLAADYMETSILGFLYEVVSNIIETTPFVHNENYRIEYTTSVTTTLAKKVGEDFIYLHSNVNAHEEAWQVVQSWREPQIDNYVVAGLGLGYHVAALAESSFVTVEVYEEDAKVIELAKEYSSVADQLKDKKIRIIHDPEYQLFLTAAKRAKEHEDREKVCLYHPAIRTIQHDLLRQKMEHLFIQMDNTSRSLSDMIYNFRYNTEHVKNTVMELAPAFKNKTIYLIAGGPSLDKNIHILKDRKKEDLVLTVGTSLRRCLEEGINPDYVMITDPTKAVHRQITGIEDGNVPMIILSTTYANITKDYKAKKYIAFQSGYRPAEELASQCGSFTVESGGSVTTTAIDLCISLGVSKIVFLGLDLAFTDGKLYHDKSSDTVSGGELLVEGIHGNKIPTAKSFNIYREWIENRICKAKSLNEPIEFIDATEGGAKIAGTTIKVLKDII